MESFGKDEHGMRLKDFNHKDRQNYDAVVHITSDAVQNILSTIPDEKRHTYIFEIYALHHGYM